MSNKTYMQALVWCCTSCGYSHEGGQPLFECPICESYKSAFIDIPQNIEASVRDEFGEDAANSADARSTRLDLLAESGHLKKFRVKGRFLEAVYDASSSRKYLG